MKREIMEGTFFEKKVENMCKNFSYKDLPDYDQEYLVSMLNSIRATHTCPKTFEPFEVKYPNARKFQLYVDNPPEGSTYYASHLLAGKKYFLVWDHD
jgi:hypothetical protein